MRIDPWAAGYYWVMSARDAHFVGGCQPRTWRVVAVPSGVMPHSDRANRDTSRTFLQRLAVLPDIQSHGLFGVSERVGGITQQIQVHEDKRWL